MPISQPKTIPFTADAYHQLEQEHFRLVKERAEVIVRLQAAREQGDLSENGAYIYAKRELGNIGRRQREINYLLTNGYIKELNTHYQTVEFGCRVTLEKTNQQLEYLIVSKHESDPLAGKLSTASPLGQAILGKKVGETVKVTTPTGIVEYQITKIR